MTDKIEITDELRQRIFDLRASGLSRKRIAEAIGMSEWPLRDILDPTHLARRRDRERKGLRVIQSAHQEPPRFVIDERDRAYSAPRSLTAIAFGDPMSGRSALDRRG